VTEAHTIQKHFETVKQSTDRKYSVMIIDDSAFSIFNKENLVTGVKLLKSQFSHVKLSYAATPSYFLSRSLKLKLEWMEAAGLIDFYTRKYIERLYLEVMQEPKDPKKLTFDQLAIGFQLILLLLAFATFSFAVEVLWFNLRSTFSQGLATPGMLARE